MLSLPHRGSKLPLVLLVALYFYQQTLALALSSSKDPSAHSNMARDESIYEDARAFNEYASAAVDLSNAHVTKDGLLTVVRSVRDIDQNKRRLYLYNIPLPVNGQPTLAVPPVELNDDIKMRIPSRTGDKIAIFREETTSGDENKRQQVLEVWTNQGQALLRRILLNDKLHGKIISDPGGFGTPTWNNDETALVYVAERNPPETASFFDDDYHDLKKETESNEKHRGAKFTLGLGKTESWGEKYSKQSALLDLFCVHVGTGKVGRIDNCPGVEDKTTIGSYAVGQPIFSPDGQSVVYVAWDAGGGADMPRRLGLIYCQQRPCKLYASSITKLFERLSSLDDSDEQQEEKDEGYVVLTPDNRLSKSPRFSPAADDGSSSLVFLSSKKGFETHSGCLALHSIDWKDGKAVTGSERVLVAQVWDPRKSPMESGKVFGLQFPGLFLQQLPDSCFLSAESLLAVTQWGSCVKVVRISLKDGSLRFVSCGESISSDELLCTTNDGSAIISTKTSNSVAALWRIPAKELFADSVSNGVDKHLIARLPPIASTRFSAVPFSPIFDFSCDVRLLDDIPKVDGVDIQVPVQSVLLLPDPAKRKNPPPLIVVPHGGPHSASSTSYIPSYAYLCGHGGYAVLMVNYRGSTGFGQGLLEALPRRIGELDVKDVIAATMATKVSGLVDPDRIGICGGSHGGFLTAHCTSRYPDLFKAAAMRNPVVNFPSMVTATDIPDFCYVEGLGTYHWQEYRPPSKEEIQIMWDRSPIRFSDSVKTPTLVALGMKDLRVPPSQGLEWYHTLRSKGVPTKLLTYDEDDHAIAGVVSESDHWVNIKRWFDEYL